MKTYQTTIDIAKCIYRWYTHVKYYQAKSIGKITSNILVTEILLDSCFYLTLIRLYIIYKQMSGIKSLKNKEKKCI